MWLTRICLKNPYFATVIMMILVFLGFVAYNRISVEERPDVTWPFVVVSIPYNGASPEVVETDVTKPMEEGLNTLNGVKTIRSYSTQGNSTVVVEFNLKVDPAVALSDVRDKVANIATLFRKEVGIPLVLKTNTRDEPIMTIAFSSDVTSLKNITDWLNKFAIKKIQTVQGVGEVKMLGGVTRIVRINVQPYKLQSLGLSINDIATAIKNANNEYPAGLVKGNEEDINVKLNGKLKTIDDFANIVIKYRKNVPIKVSDVAQIIDGQDDLSSLTYINGKKAVSLDIWRSQQANTLQVIQEVYKSLGYLKTIMPKNIDYTVTYDQSQSINRAVKAVKNSIVEGALLTILIVFIFLKSWRSTVITGLTLPISVMGTIFVIYMLGFTLNQMTLLALSLSIGLLIDDAIVVRENIVRHLHLNKSHFESALDGTNEIGLAVLATTLTIVAVFLPVGLMNGIIGKYFYQFGITVVVAVLISLFVSFTLDPMLSSIWIEPKNGGIIKRIFIGRLLDKFELLFIQFEGLYKRVLLLAVHRYKTTLVITIIVVIGSFLLVPFIGGEFVPPADKGKFNIFFKTAIGSNLDYTSNKALEVAHLLNKNIPEIKTIFIAVNGKFASGTNQVKIKVDIGSKLERHRSIREVSGQARQLLSSFAGISLQSVTGEDGGGGSSKPVSIDIKGDNVSTLKEISQDIKNKISKIKGVTDVETTFDEVTPALAIKIDRDIASQLKVNVADVGNTISTLFAGNKVSTWEDTKNGQNYDVFIQIPEMDRTLLTLQMLKIPSENISNNNLPKLISLSEIAKYSKDVMPQEIDHLNLFKMVNISANITSFDKQKVFKQINEIIEKVYVPSGYKVEQSGDNQDMNESFIYAVQALLIGIIFIYFILTAQFKSFLLPIIIMIALPLSFVGVFLSLIICHSTLNIFSIIGIIMLMGLAAKNGILLVDFIDNELDRGKDIKEAIINAGSIRLRPIIMTTMAMIFGMLPIALSVSEGSEVRKPMAYAIIGGLTSSTLLTLIVVPVMYITLLKVTSFLKEKFN